MLKIEIAKEVWLELGGDSAVLCKLPNVFRFLSMAAEYGLETTDEGVQGDRILDMMQALAREDIVGWRGICDMNGANVEFSVDHLESFINDMDAVVQFFEKYQYRATKVDAEKNDSPPSLNGNTAVAENTAAAENIAETAQQSATSAPEK